MATIIIWVIGMGITYGLCEDEDTPPIGLTLAVFVMWPVMLGTAIRELIENNHGQKP